MSLTEAKRRLLEHLKTVDAAVASELAEHFGLTEAAVRQHLDGLAELGLVERCPLTRSGRGRPAQGWRLTTEAERVFADRHGELTVDLLAAIETVGGRPALDAVLAERTRIQLHHYRLRLGEGQSLAERVAGLARLRTEEGYHAEARDEDGAVTLVEHHCPIAAAARSCGGVCASELELFSAVVGPEVAVERIQHAIGGDRRCAYRFSLPTS